MSDSDITDTPRQSSRRGNSNPNRSGVDMIYNNARAANIRGMGYNAPNRSNPLVFLDDDMGDLSETRNEEKQYFCPPEFQEDLDDQTHQHGEGDDHNEDHDGCMICENITDDIPSNTIKSCLMWDKVNIDSLSPQTADQRMINVYQKQEVDKRIAQLKAKAVRDRRELDMRLVNQLPRLDQKKLNKHWNHGIYEHRELMKDIKATKTIEKFLRSGRMFYMTRNGSKLIDLTSVDTLVKLNKHKYMLVSRLSEFKANAAKMNVTLNVKT